MRLARIMTPDGPRPVVADGATWSVVEDLFADPLVRTGETHPVEGAVLLAPVEPRVVVGVMANGSAQAREVPPLCFQKSARTASGPGDAIRVDAGLGRTNGEGELVLVVGRASRRVSVEDAPAHVLGWTVGNDVTNIGQDDPKGIRVKNGDGYTPLGPWIETDPPDGLDLQVTVEVDGVEVVRGRTGELGWRPHETFSHLTQYLTLDAGDVVLTGAAGTMFPVVAGNHCRITIEGIGTLENPVVADVG